MTLSKNYILENQMNLFQNSGDGFQNNEETAIVVSFYNVPNVDDLRCGREAVNLPLY